MGKTDWTKEQKLAALMALPWDVRVERDEEGDLFARIAEIPDAVADGATERELGRELWQSLYASLVLRLDRGDPIPLPAKSALPWEMLASPAWHPASAVAAPFVIHREAYLKAVDSQNAAGKFAIVV